jgi:hypothetical protein
VYLTLLFQILTKKVKKSEFQKDVYAEKTFQPVTDLVLLENIMGHN